MSKKKPSSKKSVIFMSPAEVAQNAARALKLLRDVTEALPGMAVLDREERIHSNGRIREGEAEVMHAVLDACDAHPKFFEALAPIDHGKDPRKVETKPARDDLERRVHLSEVAAAVEELGTKLSDTLLVLGASVREVTGPAYRLGKTAAQVNAEVRRALGTATTFYGTPAREHAKDVKKAKKTEAGPRVT
jgi:hypothetical protein